MKNGLKCVLATIATILLMATPVIAVELFRYRGAANDGGTLEYIFEAGDQNSPNAITKEKAAEIAADFMTTFYHVQVGALENSGISNDADSFLARLLFGHGQGADETMFFCRSAAGGDGSCGASVEKRL
jgi:hypothetical protein